MKEHPNLVKGFDAVTERLLLKYFGSETQAGRVIFRGRSVLCVGARDGGEIRAFKALGALAIGIDLFPTSPEHVLKGDAHNLFQFGNNTFDIVFTNVLDHIPLLERIVAEARRVLKPGGLLISDVFVDFVQTKAQNEWAVRENGDAAFFAEYGAILERNGFSEQRRDKRRTKQHDLSR